MISFLAQLHSTETVFYQPNYSRSRHALRSPLNSERLNLEDNQFAFDIAKLYENIALLEAKIEQDLTIINSGDSTVYNVTMSGDATPTAVTIKSLNSITRRVEALSKRLEVLEKGLG